MPAKRINRPIHPASEQGFTLPELMITIVLMGILAAIAIPSWFGIVESRNVTAAANQVAADLRLAHSSATNRLGTANLSFDDVTADGLTVTCNGITNVSYCLVRPEGSSTIATPKSLPSGVAITSRSLTGGTVANITGKITSAERSVYFDNSGVARVAGNGGIVILPGTCPAGTPSGPAVVVAASDGSPRHCITINSATSKVNID